MSEEWVEGTPIRPHEQISKTWTIRNAGDVPWRGRFLTRQKGAVGGCADPGQVEIPETRPGKTVKIAVVCRRDSAILAVAEPRTLGFVDGAREAGPLAFVDAPALAASLAEQPGFQVLTPSELNGPLDAASWPEVLSDDITYWQPGTLGEALFNYWD